MGGEFSLLPFILWRRRNMSVHNYLMTDFVDDALQTALNAAHAAAELLRSNFGKALNVASLYSHDVKIELDVRSQELISSILLGRFPEHGIYGEEGIAGNQQSPLQWIIDPIDGTVNFFYNIPHFCISIALRDGTETLLGVILDPIRNELWQVKRGQPATLNGVPCCVSSRREISEGVISIGFSKTKVTIDSGLPLFEKMVYRARKCRMMGSAALDMAYVACGRLDAYIEQAVSLWDIAAGKLLIESAGGRVQLSSRDDMPDKFAIVASNGSLDFT
jgi:myo-inositol-1(or 4)-monophosphatase